MECSLQISIVQIPFVLLVSETFFFFCCALNVKIFTTDCLKWSTLVVETFGLGHGHGHGLDYLYTDNHT